MWCWRKKPNFSVDYGNKNLFGISFLTLSSTIINRCWQLFHHCHTTIEYNEYHRFYKLYWLMMSLIIDRSTSKAIHERFPLISIEFTWTFDLHGCLFCLLSVLQLLHIINQKYLLVQHGIRLPLPSFTIQWLDHVLSLCSSVGIIVFMWQLHLLITSSSGQKEVTLQHEMFRSRCRYPYNI